MSELRILELSSFFKIPASASGDNGICDRFFGKLENLTIKNNFTIKKETKMWQGVSVKITFKEFFEDNSSPNVKSLELRKLLESKMPNCSKDEIIMDEYDFHIFGYDEDCQFESLKQCKTADLWEEGEYNKILQVIKEL